MVESGTGWLEETLANRRWHCTTDRRFVSLCTQRVSVVQRLRAALVFERLVDAPVASAESLDFKPRLPRSFLPIQAVNETAAALHDPLHPKAATCFVLDAFVSIALAVIST